MLTYSSQSFSLAFLFIFPFCIFFSFLPLFAVSFFKMWCHRHHALPSPRPTVIATFKGRSVAEPIPNKRHSQLCRVDDAPSCCSQTLIFPGEAPAQSADHATIAYLRYRAILPAISCDITCDIVRSYLRYRAIAVTVECERVNLALDR